MKVEVAVTRIYDKVIVVDVPNDYSYEDLEKAVKKNKEEFVLVDESIEPLNDEYDE